jgi:hypothetical protein
MKHRKSKARKRPLHQRKLETQLTKIRDAAKRGAAEAIEHCGNFWSVSDGYKKYIDFQVETRAKALMLAVRSAVRAEFSLHEIANRRHRKKPP